MKIWKQKIFDTDNCNNSKFVIVGNHEKLGDGILSYHKHEWHAMYNTMLINSDGGKATVMLNKNFDKK